MMLKAFTVFIISENKKELFRTDDIKEAIKYLEDINFYQHSGRFRDINLHCLFNPDLNMAFIDECIEMKLEDIKPNPVHIEEEKHIEEVRQSIESQGLIVPLSVDLDNNLLDGHHRYRALKALGVETLMVLKKSREWYKNMEGVIRDGKENKEYKKARRESNSNH